MALLVGFTICDGGVWVRVKKECDGGFIEDVDVLVQPLHPLDLDDPQSGPRRQGLLVGNAQRKTEGIRVVEKSWKRQRPVVRHHGVSTKDLKG